MNFHALKTVRGPGVFFWSLAMTTDNSFRLPSKKSGTSAVLPILLVVVGVVTLLGQFGIMSSFNQIWTIGLAAVGVLTFLINGYNKSTFVFGSFLILSSGMSILRTQEILDVGKEIPILFIALGSLMLIARSKAIPDPTPTDD